MNKVFKVIWSEARNAYVVVSEIAKNHGSKSCSTKKLLAMLIATGVMTCASMAPAMAADPPAEALKHSTVAAGYNITVTPKDNSDGGKEYNVDLKNDIYLQGDDPDALVSISGSKGTIWATGSVTVGSGVDGSVVMDGTTATVSGLGNTTTAYDGFANGKGKAATEEQLKEVATEAGKHTTVTDGANITVTEGLNKDGGKEYKVALNNDILLSGDNDAFVNISGSKGSVWASSSVAAGNVVMDGASATVSGLSNQTTAYDGFANGKGKAATEEQLKEISKVADNANQGWNLSTNGDAASKVAPGETVYFSGDKNISVSNNGKDVKDELNKDLDVNSVQTNALNAKYNLSVGTANENGTVPFFVNSNGAFYAANGKLVVDKDGKLVAPEAELGKVTADEGVIGNVVLKDGVFYKNSALRDGELFVGDASGNYSQITTKGAKLGKVTVAEDGKISGVAAGAITADSTDAVNGSQPHAVATEAGKHSKVVNGNNTNVEETTVDGQKVYKVNLNNNIMVGDITGKYVSISGTNGTIEATGAIATKDRVYADKGAKLADIDVTGNKISNGASSIVLDGSNVKVNDKVTIDQNGKISGVAAGEISKTSTDAINGSQLNQTNENVAALDKRVTDNETAIKNNADAIKKNADAIKNNTDAIKNNADAISGLNTRVDKVEALAGKHTTLTNGTNISVQETDVDGQKNYKVNMNKDIILGDLTGKNVNISGTNGTIETTGYIATKDRVYADKGAKLADIDVTGNKISNGASSIVLDGSNVKVNDKVTIDQNGKVTGVADGDVKENSKDAVNGSQLYKTNQEVVNNTNRINQLGSRVNKVGAGAAALAALHPMDFDPDDKLTFSAGYGNYGGENAAAIGAYYRPDEKVMFSIGGTVGNGENMVNAGVSFSLDRTNHVSNSRTAMAREILDLRAEVTELKAMVAKGGLGSIAEDKMKIFPDVAENHWAYEYVGKLAAAGIIEGYPDGKFSGDRMMSRYEFAAMLYRAMQKGAQLDSKIINEFAPEMGRIRVDRISGEDGDRDKIERVRVNAVKGERDHYGNKLAK